MPFRGSFAGHHETAEYARALNQATWSYPLGKLMTNEEVCPPVLIRKSILR